jgi:hypothetical protein
MKKVNFEKGRCTLVIIISAAIMFVLPAYGQTQITTAEELAALNSSETSLAGNYILMNDLTLDDWIPVGGFDDRDDRGFSGTFDGNGHTITITGFRNSFDNTKIGLFGVIGEGGVVKNLSVTGNATYTCHLKSLYIGGIAGINYGLITCCVSGIVINGDITDEKTVKKVKSVPGYEDGAFGGGVAGINVGTITNCYSTGSILISGKRHAVYAGGIAGGNGHLVGGSIGIGFSSGGGGGISASQKAAKVSHIISRCYSTASIISNGSNNSKITPTVIQSGGIVAMNRVTATTNNCVSLNKTIKANGNGSGNILLSTVLAPSGWCYHIYYRDDIEMSKYLNGKEKKPGKRSKKDAVALSDTQDPAWWYYPEGLTEKQRNSQFGFNFGGDEQSPWIWNDKIKRPVLYWETGIIEENHEY